MNYGTTKEKESFDFAGSMPADAGNTVDADEHTGGECGKSA